MTISVVDVSDSFPGDDATVAFNTNFIFVNASDLVVKHIDASNVVTTYTLNVDYTVSGGSYATGTVTLTTAHATGETLFVERQTPRTQGEDITADGSLQLDKIERGLDRLTLILQERDAVTDRSVQFADVDGAAVDAILPTPVVASRLIGINAAGDGLSYYAATDLTGSVVSSFIDTLLDDEDQAEAVATLFSKGSDVASAATLVVPVNGGYHDVTGTTNITAITVGAGRLFVLQFDGALTLTDGASLKTGSGNITTAAGDRGIFYATAANTVELLAWFPEADPAAKLGQGKHIIGEWGAAGLIPSTTNGCASLANKESTTNDVMDEYLAFDASSIEYGQCDFRAPAMLAETTLTAELEWSEDASATSHDCVWQIEMQAQGDGDTIDSAWGTAITVTDTGTSGTRRTATFAAITPGGTWAAGDTIKVRVGRKATDGSDTLDVDAHLHRLTIFGTVNASVEP